jgi:hypothetical protein
VSEVRGGAVHTFYVHPSDFGLTKAAAGALAGGDATVNAAIVTRVLGGEPGPARDVVLLNAGAALMVAGEAGSVREGIARAGEAIDAGHALRTLERLVAASRAGQAANGRGCGSCGLQSRGGTGHKQARRKYAPLTRAPLVSPQGGGRPGSDPWESRLGTIRV